MTPRVGRAALRLALFYLGSELWARRPDDPAGEAQRAKELMAAGQYEQAIPIYQRIVKAMPGNSGVLSESRARRAHGGPRNARRSRISKPY